MLRLELVKLWGVVAGIFLRHGLLIGVLVDEVDQLADDRLERRVLVLLRSLVLVMQVLVVFCLTTFGLWGADIG